MYNVYETSSSSSLFIFFNSHHHHKNQNFYIHRQHYISYMRLHGSYLYKKRKKRYNRNSEEALKQIMLNSLFHCAKKNKTLKFNKIFVFPFHAFARIHTSMHFGCSREWKKVSYFTCFIFYHIYYIVFCDSIHESKRIRNGHNQTHISQRHQIIPFSGHVIRKVR